MDFAIAREKDAVLFYQYLQKKVRFESQKEVLREFELIEIGHVQLLERVKTQQSLDKLSRNLPEDLQLSSYLHDVEPDENMTYQQILITAMKKEERSAVLYSSLRDQSEDPDLRKIFDQLMKEEENHRHHFETLYERDIQGQSKD
jgi:rubrerythrin